MERAWGVVVPRERIDHACATLTDEALASLLDSQLERLGLPQLRQALLEAAQHSRFGAMESLNTYLAAWGLALTQAQPRLGLTASELQVAHSFRANIFDNQLVRDLEFSIRVEVPEVIRAQYARAHDFPDVTLRPQRLASSFQASRSSFLTALDDPARYLVVQEQVTTETVEIGGRSVRVPDYILTNRHYEIMAGGVELPPSLVRPNAERWLANADRRQGHIQVASDLRILTAALVAMPPEQVRRFFARLPEVLRYPAVAIDYSINVSDPAHPGAVVYLYGLSGPGDLPPEAVPMIWPANEWGPRPDRTITVPIQDGGNARKSKPTKERQSRPVRRLNLSRDNEVQSNVPHDEHLQCTNHVDQRLARRRRGASLQWYVDPDEHK